MSLEQQILEYLGRAEYTPQNQKQIGQALGLNKNSAKSLRRVVHKLLDQGAIAKFKSDRLVIPRDANLVTGTIRFRQSGSAVVLTVDHKIPKLEVRAEDTDVALHDDTVLVRLIEEPKWRQHRRGKRNTAKDSDEQYARVIRILKRKNDTIIGTLKRERSFHYVLPDDPRICHDILVKPPKKGQARIKCKVDDKVVVKLSPWTSRQLNPQGIITKVLGKTHEPKAEFEAILHKYKLDTDFSENIKQAVAQTPNKVSKAEAKTRTDCRKLFTTTIDPDDAKDFDDAISIEKLSKGGVRIGIHIADVAHYVKSGSILDIEAQKRGNSSYLVNSVIPMLPRQLSNGICSLVEAEDRLTKCVFLDFDDDGRLINRSFANCVIRSDKRLSYRQAYALLKKDDLKEIRNTPMPPAHQTGSPGKPLGKVNNRELRKLQQHVRTLWRIASRLRKARMKEGSLDLDMPEVKIWVDESGYASRMEKIDYDESHQLIEEFMLAANEQMAKAFFEAKMPTLSRVHDAPDADKLSELRAEMAVNGITVGDLTKRPEVTKLLRKIKGHPQEYALKIKFLRSLKQACYRAAYDGHYGLCKTYYLHFTSPIRRYSDLVAHRQLDTYLHKHQPGHNARPDHKPYRQGELEKIGQHLSITERNSQDAENESRKVKTLEFFEGETTTKHKTNFQAIITDIKNHGMFIELTESMAFGFIHISTLRDDIYHTVDDGTKLRGRRHHRSFGIGDYIHVQVERVNRFKRQLDFVIVGQ